MTSFQTADGTEIAYQTLGEGKPVLLLHGLFSSGHTNWIRYGAAADIASAGFQLILPAFRAHGASGKPHDPALYPADILAADIEALIAHLGLTDYILGGYSLGARTTVRLLARGHIPPPAKVVLGGMGLSGITDIEGRSDFFLGVIKHSGTFKPGSAEYAADAFMRQNAIDTTAAAHLLRTQQPTPLETVRTLTPATLVIAGENDHDNGSASELALALPHASHATIPGNHMSAVTKPDFGTAIAAWLAH
ncbi:alpha/beta hydrolase [Polymorphobacter multimanifer]|uniref:alpha/beta fold hydrolase n=1 Tax=Polymorphobacter multimanifer TaxID=1070431 RepID=UPI001669C0E6|nr:alpha/beta hydrolase [Polymorphobacter multimanifer]GGI93972.1 alpha/beta hydrolase [Polymorphobacter multimanifer]